LAVALIDTTHEFYRPLGVRIAIVVVTVAWAAFELFYAKQGFWSVIAVAICALAIWSFLIAYKEPPPKPETKSGEK
jgi:hypothetical protein